MRSKLGKEIRKHFENGMQRINPPFNRVPATLSFAVIYACKIAPELTLYLELLLDQRYDHFDIYMAWSNDDKVPDIGGGRAPPDAPRSDLFYIRELWGGHKSDLWWELAPAPSFDHPESFLERAPLEECLPKVKPAVDDALRCIREYALPYFARVAAARGLRLPETPE